MPLWLKLVVGASLGGAVIVGSAIVFGRFASSIQAREVAQKVALDARVGTCIDTQARTVPCAEPHRFEVFGIYVSDTASRPERAAGGYDETCQALFEAYVGTSFDRSTYDYEPRHPNEVEWEAGARTTLCVLFPSGGGSASGTAARSGR